MGLTKDGILSKVSTYDILNYYLQPFHLHGSQLRQGVNISNPFIPEKQKTPSFNIYCNLQDNLTWKFHDFATGDQGDCFDLIQRLFSLDFSGALKKINDDFCLNLDNRNARQQKQKSTNPVVPVPKPFTISPKPFSQKELDYWNQYGIKQETLAMFNVISLSNFTSVSKEGKEFTVNSSVNDFIFSYSNENWHKIYKPLGDKKYRFQFLGTKPADYVFGLTQLPKKGNLLFITGGEKDLMTLSAQGYNAISLNSETATLSDSLAEELKSRFDYFIILYDNDSTGISQAEALCIKHGLRNLVLPAMENGKDISDFFLLGNSVDELQLMIDDCINQPEPEIINIKSDEPKKQETNNPAQDSFSNLHFPDELFDILPDFLKNACKPFNNKVERDMFLLGALTVISGCLPNYYGIYRQSKVFANIYTFIIAIASTGKGCLTYAKMLGNGIHNFRLQLYLAAKEKYEQELAIYEAAKRDKKNNAPLKKPVEPPLKLLFIPANTSSAAFISVLNENDASGILFSSEADTLSGALKQEWGNFSDILRQAYHHETVSMIRRKDREHISIENPALSILLSGTFDQIIGLIPTADNGLFSRFCYLIMDLIPVMDDVFANNDQALEDYFTPFADDLLKLYKSFQFRKIKFSLAKHQQRDFLAYYESYHNIFFNLLGPESIATVRRLALNQFRMAMILTALRSFGNNNNNPEFVCSDDDFNASFIIAKTLLTHAENLFVKLNKATPAGQLKTEPRKLYNALPINQAFNLETVMSIADSINMKRKTAEGYLYTIFKPKNLIEYLGTNKYIIRA